MWSTSSTVSFWIIASQFHYDSLQYLASFVIGVCNGALWVSKSLWLGRIIEDFPADDIPFFTNLFNSIYCASNIIGPGMQLLVTNYADSSLSTILWALLGMSAFATLLLLFAAEVRGSEPWEQVGFLTSISQAFGLLRTPQMFLLGIFAFKYGAGRSFVYNWLPKKTSLDNEPWIFLTFGVSSILTSSVMTKYYKSSR